MLLSKWMQGLAGTHWAVIHAWAWHRFRGGDEVRTGSRELSTSGSRSALADPVRNKLNASRSLSLSSYLYIFCFFFTFGALWPIGACGPRRDLMAKRIICLLTKMKSSTNTCHNTTLASLAYPHLHKTKLSISLTKLPYAITRTTLTPDSGGESAMLSATCSETLLLYSTVFYKLATLAR